MHVVVFVSTIAIGTCYHLLQTPRFLLVDAAAMLQRRVLVLDAFVLLVSARLATATATLGRSSCS